MKKVSLMIIVMLFLISSDVFAQRYLPGLRGLQVTASSVDGLNGYSLQGAYTRYDRHENRWLIGLGMLNKRLDDQAGHLPANQFTVEGGYFMNFLSDGHKIFFFSLGIEALAGYETVNWGDKLLPDGGRLLQRDRFIYGGACALEIESYITDRWVILLNVKERVMWGGDTNRFHLETGLGLKYIIN